MIRLKRMIAARDGELRLRRTQVRKSQLAMHKRRARIITQIRLTEMNGFAWITCNGERVN